MNRRDLLKLGIIFSPLMLSGCGSKTSDGNGKPYLEITPKKTGLYSFSAPLPFDYGVIDEIVELNNKYTQSKITNLYNCVPRPLVEDFNNAMQAGRGHNYDIKSYEDFAKYAKYAMKKGFHICYLLNSPKPFTEKDYKEIEPKFKKLLDFLQDIGIDEIKFGNTQVASLVNKYKKFRLSASTCLEYHNITQYKNLVHNYPNIFLFDIAEDENHNFAFLKNLKTMFPTRNIELMVNEFCFKGCPARIFHPGGDFCNFDCPKIFNERTLFQNFYHSAIIYPWNLPYYSALGINNFKFSSTPQPRAVFTDLSFVRFYLDCVEYGVENVKAQDFIDNMIIFKFNKEIKVKENLMVKDIMPYLLDVGQFIKHGHECAVRCGTVCNYCDNQAAKMEKFLS
ncbi:MAG: hypothetical protein K6C94_02360 [Candidatus Gastranaerophilales bacterium]|nr:hypothetical protein [Candidatus Gastranaerophilales bacterium]